MAVCCANAPAWGFEKVYGFFQGTLQEQLCGQSTFSKPHAATGYAKTQTSKTVASVACIHVYTDTLQGGKTSKKINPLNPGEDIAILIEDYAPLNELPISL